MARSIWGVFSRARRSPGDTGKRALIGASSLGLILAATSVGWAPGAFAAQAGAPHGRAARGTSGIQARTQSAPSCNDNWLGGSGVWTDGSSWSAGQPTENSNVCITAPGTYTVTIDSLFYVNSYTIGGASGSQTLAVDSNNDNEAALVVHGVTNSEINHNGALVLNSTLVDGKAYAAALGIDVVGQSFDVTPAHIRYAEAMYSHVADAIESRIFTPRRPSNLCSRKHCAFWRNCEADFGGEVPA